MPVAISLVCRPEGELAVLVWTVFEGKLAILGLAPLEQIGEGDIRVDIE